MALLWLAAFLLAIAVPPFILVIAGYAASRLAGRAAALQQGPEYPTEQMLALTYREAPEQWPPVLLIEEPWIGEAGTSD